MFKAHVRKGDTVKVIAGEDAGKTGNVLSVDRASQRVVVEGINIQKRHTRHSQANPEGGIVRRPGPVHISNVMLVCPNCNQATRVGRSRGTDGSVTRVCKRCGKAID